MILSQLSRRDRWTYGLAALAVVAIIAFNVLGMFRHSAATSTRSLAAAWNTYGGPCAAVGQCPQQWHVMVYQDGTYIVTTLYGTNADTSGQLSPSQAAQLAQGEANPGLPTAAPGDCGSYLFEQHVKITVASATGSTRTLDTCLNDVPSSSPLVELLEGLAKSGTHSS